MLSGVLQKLLPESVHPFPLVFEGKSDLDKRLTVGDLSSLADCKSNPVRVLRLDLQMLGRGMDDVLGDAELFE